LGEQERAGRLGRERLLGCAGWAGRGSWARQAAGKDGTRRGTSGPGGGKARCWATEREEGEGWLGRGLAREGGGAVGLVLFSPFLCLD
jgi:hypothetical protein